jgi:hypothetical protein
MKHGAPDYPAWAQRVARQMKKLSAVELQWLLADNGRHFDEYETAYPQAGVALEDRIKERVAALERG